MGARGSMGSTGEPDRKRRHFGSISPTAATAAAAATAKKQPFLPLSEDKKVGSSRSFCFSFLKTYVLWFKKFFGFVWIFVF